MQPLLSKACDLWYHGAAVAVPNDALNVVSLLNSAAFSSEFLLIPVCGSTLQGAKQQ
jgi:hypothetical protein